MAKLYVSTMKTDTVKHIMGILRKLQITTSKLYHNGKFNEDLSDEFFKVYDEAEALHKKYKKLIDDEEMLNY